MLTTAQHTQPGTPSQHHPSSYSTANRILTAVELIWQQLQWRPRNTERVDPRRAYRQLIIPNIRPSYTQMAIESWRKDTYSSVSPTHQSETSSIDTQPLWGCSLHKWEINCPENGQLNVKCTKYDNKQPFRGLSPPSETVCRQINWHRHQIIVQLGQHSQ